MARLGKVLTGCFLYLPVGNVASVFIDTKLKKSLSFAYIDFSAVIFLTDKGIDYIVRLTI